MVMWTAVLNNETIFKNRIMYEILLGKKTNFTCIPVLENLFAFMTTKLY